MEPSSKIDRYRCEKHRLDIEDACPKCKDPDLYCKFRTACVIHFMERERKKSTAG